jgi:hypothetical protein
MNKDDRLAGSAYFVAWNQFQNHNTKSISSFSHQYSWYWRIMYCYWRQCRSKNYKFAKINFFDGIIIYLFCNNILKERIQCSNKNACNHDECLHLSTKVVCFVVLWLAICNLLLVCLVFNGPPFFFLTTGFLLVA